MDDIAAASSVIGARKRTRAVDAVSAAAALAAANPSVAPPLAAGDASSRPAIVPGSPLPPPGASSAASPPPSRPAPKPGWLRKHRERRPAVAVAFVPHELVEGDPNAWVSLVALLDAARDAAALGDCKLAVVVVGDDAPERLPEDRASAVRRQARVDARSLLTLPQPPPPDALRRLASLCRDLADERYDAERARREALFARRRAASDEAGAASRLQGGRLLGVPRRLERREPVVRDRVRVPVARERGAREAGDGDDPIERGSGSGRVAAVFFARRDEVLAAAEATHRAIVTLALARAPRGPDRGRLGGGAPEASLRGSEAAAGVAPEATRARALAVGGGAARGVWRGARGEDRDGGDRIVGSFFRREGNEGERRASSVPPGVSLPRRRGRDREEHPRDRGARRGRGRRGRRLGRLGRLGRDGPYPRGAADRAPPPRRRRRRRARAAETAPRLFTALASRLAENYLRVNDALAAKTRLRSVADAYRREGWDDLARGADGAERCAGEDPRERLEVCLELAALAPASARDGDQHGGDAAGAMAAANAAAAEAREHAGARTSRSSSATSRARAPRVPGKRPRRLAGERCPGF